MSGVLGDHPTGLRMSVITVLIKKYNVNTSRETCPYLISITPSKPGQIFLFIIFLRFDAFFLNICFPPMTICPISRMIGLSSLSDSWQIASITFLRKLISGFVDSPTLPEDINFRVPTHRLRNFTSSMVLNTFLILQFFV